MTIRVLFYGRKIGAIGLSGFQCVDLPSASTGDSRDEIVRRLYDTHEHIDHHSVKIISLKEE